jgi:hypothetical protein
MYGNAAIVYLKCSENLSKRYKSVPQSIPEDTDSAGHGGVGAVPNLQRGL